jgi:hypothetical protein
MTTFTTEDRLIAEQNGSVTINVEPIPFAGLITITESAPKSEPVAWMEYIQDEEWEVWFVEPTDLPKGHTYKPLYTHPAKTLTDEEIEQVFYSLEIGHSLNDFAKAILRKAQEK